MLLLAYVNGMQVLLEGRAFERMVAAREVAASICYSWLLKKADVKLADMFPGALTNNPELLQQTVSSSNLCCNRAV